MGILRADQGLLVTLEDAVFDDRGRGRSSRWIEDWSVDKIKRLGGDGVKLLAWYRPDADPEVVDHQRELVETTGRACRHFDLPFVLELLVHPLDGDDERALEGSRRAELVLESVATFSDDRFGVDVFKVESPFRATELPVFGHDDEAHRAVFWELSRTIDRPWVLLSGGAERSAFANALRYAYDAGASGYLAGRSIWWDAVDRFPDWEDMRAVLRTDSAPFMAELNEMTRAMATPVFERFGVLTEALLERPGVDFRHNYGSMVDEQATRRPTMMGAVR
jgi:tagatose 1,6-diphosphate aldolase